MEELDKTYQQVVKTLTKLEKDTGIKKSNFYVLPNSEDQAITFGLFLPNQQKEDGLMKIARKSPGFNPGMDSAPFMCVIL